MPKDRFKIDLTKLKTYPISGRKNKVRRQDFAAPPSKGISFSDFYGSLPHILSGNSLRCVVDAIVSAHRKKKPVIAMMGSHVIKTGLNPVIIELLKRGIITAVALNGSGRSEEHTSELQSH